MEVAQPQSGSAPAPANEAARLRARCAELEEERADLRARLSREEEVVGAIRTIGAALGSSLDLDEVLRVILESVTRLLEAERGTIYLVDEAQQTLVARVAKGEEGREIRLDVGEGVAGWVARTGRTVNLKDAYQDRRFHRAYDEATGYRTRSVLCMPIREPRRRRTVGVVQILNKGRGYFTVADESLLRSLIAQAAITIANSQLFLTLMRKNMELLQTGEQLQDKVRELDLLYALSQQLQRTQTEDELVATVLDRSLELLPCEGVALMVYDAEGGALHHATTSRNGAVRRGSLRVRHGEGLAGRAADRGHALSSDWLSEDPDHRFRLEAAMGLAVRSALAAPLSLDEEPLGALLMVNRRGAARRFAAEDNTLLSLIADQTAKVLDLHKQRGLRAQRERLATIGQLLSSILHDIKGPISVISGYVQLMARKDDHAERERFAGVIHRQFEHLASMTQEVLSFARGDRSLLVRKCYVHSYMEELEELIRHQLQSRNIRLTIQDDHAGTAHFDQAKITRAITNLVRNALEAMGDDGRLTVVATREEGDLVFSVADTGPGIPEAIRGRIFETFVSEGKKDGSGLGLAIVRRIAEEHGGSVGYESTPGVGTRFEIRLPQPEGGS